MAIWDDFKFPLISSQQFHFTIIIGKVTTASLSNSTMKGECGLAFLYQLIGECFVAQCHFDRILVPCVKNINETDFNLFLAVEDFHNAKEIECPDRTF